MKSTMDSPNESEEESMSSGEDEVKELLETEPTLPSKRSHKEGPSVPQHISKKMKHNELYKAPTIEELKELKEAETMFHSSLFRLQIDELMTEVKTKMEFKSEFQTWLESFKAAVMNVPESAQYEINDLSWLKKKMVKVPIIRLPKHKRGFFRYSPPSEIVEIGSFVLETLCSPEPVVDVALKLPKEFWMKTDYLNHMYHRKRALYLAYLAQSLFHDPLVEDMKYSYHDDCHLRPVLMVKPKGNLGDRFQVRLLPYPAEDSFKYLRFIPQRNNVRKSWFYGEPEDEEDGASVPTPTYNSTILIDMLMAKANSFLKETILSQNVKHGIILLKVWCIQREIYGGNGLINGFILSMLVAHLLLKKRISPLMSSYQVFRNTLIALKKDNWMSQGLTLCADSTQSQPPTEEFHQHFNVVFVETSGFLNMCYSWSKEFYDRLQHEAQLALSILDSASGDSFSLLFMNKVPFYRKFENFFSFKTSENLQQYCGHLNIQDVVLDHCMDCVSSLTPKIFQVLKQGLGKRVLLLGSKMDTISHWQLNETAPNPNGKLPVFGILPNEEYMLINLEKGPPADSPETREFRSFWGGKSELRRFKDGSIHEAVLWPADTYQEKRQVLSQIIKYILERHVNISPDDITFSGSEIDVTLQMPTLLSAESPPTYATGEEIFIMLTQSFNTLTSQLRKLDGMPLMVSAVQGISPAFRHTEVFPPLPKKHVPNPNVCIVQDDVILLQENSKRAPEWILPLDVVIHLEGSGKWPDDINAIQRVKAAFNLQLSESLSKQFHLCTRAAPDFVDVLSDGFVYRLHIACHKEITLLKQEKTPEGMIKIRENKESRALQCFTEVLPKLNGVLYSVQQEHSTFGLSCRIAKRWISAQMLGDDIDTVAVELIMASVYIHPQPYTCPSSPQVALQRFLALLHAHDWETTPLIVNFGSELKKSDIADILSNFTSQRTVLPPMVIVTPLDKSGCLWTRAGPSKVVLNRLVLLANVALQTMEKKLMTPTASDFKVIFRPPLNPYDVLIHLKHKQIPKLCYSLDEPNWNKLSPLKPYQKQLHEKMPVVGFDPVQCYLRELRECFSEFAMFFYDTYGGTFIAVVWIPDAFKKIPFKVSNLNGRMISGANADGTMNMVPNVEAILDCFKKLGLGLVEKIEKLVDKWKIA